MKEKIYIVKNLHCGGCAGKIQGALEKLDGVEECTLDFYTKNLHFTFNKDMDGKEFLEKINKIADKIEPGTLIEEKNEEHHENEHEDNHEEGISNKEKISLGLGIGIFILSFFIKEDLYKDILLIIAYLIVGIDIVIKSFKNIFKGNFLDENFLMTVATFGAFGLGDYSEAAGVMIFYKIGEFFQDLAVENSKKSIKELMKIKPEFANVKRFDGKIEKVDPKDVKVGEIFIVKPGEKIPLDGVVVKGDSTVDTSALTGESMPVEISLDSLVLSGSINENGVIEIRATKTYSQSTVSKIIEMVQSASNKKASAEKFITKFARYYTPIVVGLAVIIGLGIPTLFGNFSLWLSRALIFLVISCPCALVLSVPLTFFSSIGRGSKLGILIKGGNYLEKLTEIKEVVFDKTGTLTEGKFQVESVESVGIDESKLMEYGKAGEFYSNHPIGKAIMAYGPIEIEERNIEGYNEKPGYGVITRYKGEEILAGNMKLMKEYNIPMENMEEDNTVVYIAVENKYLGKIKVSDKIKSTSKKAIEELKNMGITPYMLTGDNEKSAFKIGKELGMSSSTIHAHLLPEDKVNIFEKIKKENSGGVIFVGDGINDAPVLAMSDVGVAMGKMGSDIAVESADVVLMNDDPYKIVELLKLARKNKRVVWENIILALGIKVLVMILGVLGLADLWMAIFADVGVSILAVLNASKLLRNKAL